MSRRRSWVVVKFGGTSVSSLANWQTIEAIVRARLTERLRPVVVCSALAGVSNEIEAALHSLNAEKCRALLAGLRERHQHLAADLGVDGEALLAPLFDEMTPLVQGAVLVGEVSPRLHARIMAFGELLSTTLGAACLNARGLRTVWHDARETLLAEDNDRLNARQQFLAASCCGGEDPDWQAQLAALPADVVVTQGFIARNHQGDTVLLGRGGSDTSAAYFAARLAAARCEIWTDVPGIFSGDPRRVPTSRLLKRLDYDEAQEITAMGAKVLHPRSIPPLRDANIPIHIRCTVRPDIDGTVIAADVPQDEGAQVKAICFKYNITVVSMDTQHMWQQVGFLADVFDCFKKHGLSIDLVSTSETNVTVSLDPVANALHPESLSALVADLEKFCRVRRIGPCASVSLVGRHIRTILHQLGPALEIFGESKIHLVSQAANDLNLTFVVDEDQAERLVDQLHRLLFEQRRREALLGPTWREIFEGAPSETALPTWWRDRRDELLALAAETTPVYVYDEDTLRRAVSQLRGLQAVRRVFYSVKANAFAPILRVFHDADLGFECVSPGEVAHVLSLFPEIDRRRILFTPNFAPRHEYADALEQGVIVTLDNLFPLEHWPDLFRGREIFVRVDPGHGRGHHSHVKTAGSQSKFGVTREQFDKLVKLARKNRTRIRGLHAHTGSGILTPDNWRETATFLAALADELREVEVLDLGGGLGVVEKPGQSALDLAAVDEGLSAVKAAYPRLDLWLEPGRFLVAHAGALLARVTQTKQKNGVFYVGVDAGMHTLIRPALYGAYHEIVNLSNFDAEERVLANVVGPICESGDVLGHERALAPMNEGDVLLVAVVGAYGFAMSSNYNRRGSAREVLLPTAMR